MNSDVFFLILCARLVNLFERCSWIRRICEREEGKVEEREAGREQRMRGASGV